MRPLFLIVTSNLLAFSLGVVATLWLNTVLFVPSSSPQVTTAASMAPDRSVLPAVAGMAAAPPSIGGVAPASPSGTAGPGTVAALPRAPGSGVGPAPAPPAPPPAAPVSGPATQATLASTTPASTPAPTLPDAAAPAAAAAAPAPTLPDAATSAAPGDAAAAAPTSAPAAPGHARGAYELRFGAFSEPGNAARMQAELKKHGYAADVVASSDSAKPLRLVQLGGFPDRSAAAEAAASVRRETGIDPLVIRSTTR